MQTTQQTMHKLESQAKNLSNVLLNNLADYVEFNAHEFPNATALIEYNTQAKISWRQFEQGVNLFAVQLLSSGFIAGDVLATSLPLTKEHVFLTYACYRIGVIIAPLDLRLSLQEVVACLTKIQPKGYFYLGRPTMLNFANNVSALMHAFPGIKTWVQVQAEADGIVQNAISLPMFMASAATNLQNNNWLIKVNESKNKLSRRSPCLIIFTTGSTGSPKPALLCHENILLQNVGLAVAFNVTKTDVMLVNLPPSHVGCITELLATIIYAGGTGVVLHIFDAQKSLAAIAEHGVTILGQIPALFAAEWRHSEYKNYNLSTLKNAIYGGQAVSVEFLEKLRSMAPRMGTGLGLTEMGGFCTYTNPEDSINEIVQGLGFAFSFSPLTIRLPMNLDGFAGEEVKPGEIGEVCFAGPQVFLGYLNDPENTAKAISKDGILYTGDLGSLAEFGLKFAGRSKLVIKPKGFQVFPEDVENKVMQQLQGKITACACMGAEHSLYTEAIILFVEAVPEANLTIKEVHEACKILASYARPLHIEILDPGSIPLNRVAKTDYMSLKNMAKSIVNELRAQGKWDKK